MGFFDAFHFPHPALSSARRASCGNREGRISNYIKGLNDVVERNKIISAK
jgi:hypothetical protein